jgi:hypothetical protein
MLAELIVTEVPERLMKRLRGPTRRYGDLSQIRLKLKSVEAKTPAV